VGFDLVVDCGLGATLDRFDRLVLRTYPAGSQTAREIWSQAKTEKQEFDLALLDESDEKCGIVAAEIAGKAISSSFTGACASAVAVGEILRAIHGGFRCEVMAFHLRDFDLPRNPFLQEQYQLRVAKNGTLDCTSGARA
jgi:hypothetical protein